MQKHAKGELTDSEVKSLIYSDRDKFLKVYKQYYKSTALTKLLEWVTLVTTQLKLN